MVYISYDGYAYVRQFGGVPSGLLNTQSLDSFGNIYIIVDCMLEFGFSKTEINHMIFFIMGDDNVFFSNEEFPRICEFLLFMEEYAKQRHGMVLSVLKSVWTTLRNEIEVLGYQCNDGHPVRPIGKLVAQLAFPERPVPANKEWMHAARALGLAYASCGQDSQFHLLCEKVYLKFKTSEQVSSRRFMQTVKYTVAELLDINIDVNRMDIPDFPSLYEVRQLTSEYQGFFSETDKWKTTIFRNRPSDVNHDVITLADWLKVHPEHQFRIDNIWHGY